ncbi:Dna2/Cas4 domain-containing protein, partial [Clostridium sp.]|uniref:Dna2/Cas4 domain-containing protein n=1 Tax=Clostridium sp. TaxID=1506 RepID=UPI00258DDB89
VKWQVLLYLKKLKEKGIERKGKIEFIEKNKQDKKIIYIELIEKNEKDLDDFLYNTEQFLMGEKPPTVEFKPKCKKCAYYEYCFI